MTIQITAELLAELGNTLTDHRELNTSNYGHDDVCQLNNWAIGACETLERADLHIRSLTERLERLLNATALPVETPCADSDMHFAACLVDVEALLAAPPAAEQPDTAKVPVELAERLCHRDNYTRQMARRELRNMLLAGGE